MQVSNMVPKIYYKESRDFSYIGRLLEIILNYMKTGSDNVAADLRSENMNSLSLSLLTSTLGFESKHDYLIKDIVYVCSSFLEILKSKGTLESVEKAIRLLLASQNLSASFQVYFTAESQELTIVIPVELQDVILLKDLLEYILPTGVTLSIIIGEVEILSNNKSEIVQYDDVKPEAYISKANQTIGRIYSGKEYNHIKNWEIKDDLIQDKNKTENFYRIKSDNITYNESEKPIKINNPDIRALQSYDVIVTEWIPEE